MSASNPWEFRRIRRQLDLTQEEMADLLGTCAATVMRYERGSVRPHRHTLELLDILATIALNSERARRIHELVKRDTPRPRILWQILTWIYDGSTKS